MATGSVKIHFREKDIEIPRHVLNMYMESLRTVLHMSSNNIDVHMSFLFSGNLAVVPGFLRWCTAVNLDKELKITENGGN